MAHIRFGIEIECYLRSRDEESVNQTEARVKEYVENRAALDTVSDEEIGALVKSVFGFPEGLVGALATQLLNSYTDNHVEGWPGMHIDIGGKQNNDYLEWTLTRDGSLHIDENNQGG